MAAMSNYLENKLTSPSYKPRANSLGLVVSGT